MKCKNYKTGQPLTQFCIFYIAESKLHNKFDVLAIQPFQRYSESPKILKVAQVDHCRYGKSSSLRSRKLTLKEKRKKGNLSVRLHRLSSVLTVIGPFIVAARCMLLRDAASRDWSCYRDVIYRVIIIFLGVGFYLLFNFHV